MHLRLHQRLPTAARPRLPWRGGLGLVLAVAVLHLALLARWPSRPAGTAATGRPVLTLAQPARAPVRMSAAPAAPPEAPAPLPGPRMAAAAALPDARPSPTSPTSPTPPQAPAPIAAAVDAPAPTRTPAAAGTAPPPPGSPTAMAAMSTTATEADEPDAPAPPAAAAAPAAAGDPPPLYATRLPAPARLDYALRYNGVPGRAQLVWLRESGAVSGMSGMSGPSGVSAAPGADAAVRFRLSLDGRSTAGAPLVEQRSEGGVDAAGLAPERFVDRRRGRGWHAAHFRREAGRAVGRISFSGPLVEYPAWPGAQDRLSWVAQLAGIVAASRAPLPEVQLFVADARGRAEAWRFVPQADETVDTPMGTLPATLWRHEPQRPDGLRVEAWLDAARGHWPSRLRFTALRSGDVFELLLAAEPQAL